MSVGSFVSGYYTATWDADQSGAGAAVSLGLTREGWTLGVTYAMQAINASDKYGDSYLDGVFRGISSCRITAQHLEWTTGALAAMTMYNDTVLATTGAGFIGASKIGYLQSSLGGTLVLTDVTNTPAETKPATLTATICSIVASQELQLAFDSKLREVPLPFQVLPYLDSTVIKWISLTALMLAFFI